MTPVDAVRLYVDLARRRRAEFTIIGQHPDHMWTHARGMLFQQGLDDPLALVSDEVEWHFLQDSVGTAVRPVHGCRHVTLRLYARASDSGVIGSVTCREFPPHLQTVTLVGLEAAETMSVGHAISARDGSGARFSIRLAQSRDAWSTVGRHPRAAATADERVFEGQRLSA